MDGDAYFIVAQRLIYDCVANNIDEAWESYPDIGEYDWNHISDLAKALSFCDSEEAFKTAYELLSKRAEGARKNEHNCNHWMD